MSNVPPSKKDPGKLNSEKGKRKISWFYSTLPFNIAAGPLSTFVQLYILQIYGQTTGTVYIGLVVTVFNAVTIPASMIWGFTTDRFHKRKPIIVLSFFILTVNLLGFLLVDALYGIAFLYGAFSLFSAASATPSNLLIMETERKQKWAIAFARFSMVSSVGVLIGLVLSLVWVAFLQLQWLVVPLSLLCLVSAIMSIALISEPPFVFEREVMVMHKPSFFGRLLALPLIFLRVPKVVDFKRVFKGLKYELTSYLPVLYISIFVFYLSSGIFNTSLVPVMTAKDFSNSEVYLVILVGMVVQIFSFRYVGPYIERKTLAKTAVGGLALRSFCYASIGVAAFVISGVWFIVPALIFYPIASGVAFAAYYTSSNTMVFNTLGDRSQGSSLGVYSALVGVATMLGSLISGFTSVYFGFHITFVLAAFCLAGSALLTSTLTHFKQMKV